MSIKLYVGNLSFQTSSEDLRDLFSQAGTVESASVVEDRDTGRSRGFGFVEMGSAAEAQAAIQGLDGKSIDGRQIQVNVAKPREDRGGGGGNDRGGFGGGGNPRRRRRRRLRRRRRGNRFGAAVRRLRHASPAGSRAKIRRPHQKRLVKGNRGGASQFSRIRPQTGGVRRN